MRKGEKREDLQRARIGTCPVCGKTFRAVKDYKDKHQVYCSKECWAHRATVTKMCKYCGKEFNSYRSAKKVYCSMECRNLDYRNYTGEKSHAWQGGKTNESKCRKTSSAYREWREAVFQRDGFTCQMCGKKGVYLEAHHIKEQSNFPELRFDVGNGLTLCHECHKKTENYANKAKEIRKS